MEKLENSFEENLANELDALQSRENKGRGISCVRQIVSYLRMRDIESAKAIYKTDADKIRNYPEIDEILRDKLFSLE